ncbi:flagellar hook-length control protein FliK [Cohnella herbarum]|uniref:Flagellar hook-length control protein-like C-terminal domain-containing protein n=1 Tax=Cohnella herbarum TaxID=2728023 RepID=A0A7Z2ZLS1_9BACL|nr:flagellar hook-length control protein FliK [Cohnella herbarum]QJD83377.1 hypothetical protein HH215_09425 [Cohnella herbarum]
MNMAISSTSVSTGKAASSAAGSSAGATAGSGFAGALVQAIDGTSASGTVNNGLPLPVGLVGLLGQLGLEPSAEQSQDLLEMLASLVEQLQQLEQNGTEVLSTEDEEQLAALLAAFQGMLQQINNHVPVADGGQLVTENSEQSIPEELVPVSSKPIVQALKETLQQLSSMIASGNDDLQVASKFADQLKALLDSITAKSTNAQPAVQVVANDEPAVTAQSASKTTSTTDDSLTATKDVATQSAVAVQDTRRPAQILRDPIWRINVIDANEAEATNVQPVAVTSASGAGEASQSGSQPAWTFMQNDALANAESTAGKPTVPMQVPVQQFVTQMEKFLVKQFQMTLGNGTSEAKISLTPEHLGQVDIRIVMQNGQLTAQFMTENSAARDLLENQLSQLRTALSGQGLQVDRLEVVQQPSSSAGSTFMNQDQRHSNAGNGNGSNGKRNGESFEDPAVFAAELERNSSLKEFGYGSSINVTA